MHHLVVYLTVVFAAPLKALYNNLYNIVRDDLYKREDKLMNASVVSYLYLTVIFAVTMHIYSTRNP